MIGCVLCERELQKGEWEGWESMYIGLVCPDHNKVEIAQVTAMVLAKVKEDITTETERQARESIIWPSELDNWAR